MVSRVVFLLLGIIALGAFLCAAYFYLCPSVEEPGIIVEEPDRVYDHLVLGRDYEIEFLVHNRTGQTMRIIGGGDCPT
jgi:hypothetical protein